MSEERLSHRVVKSGMWVFAARIAERAFSFVRLIILARLLLPQDFGVLGIAMLTMSVVETFSQTGFQAALIQKKDNAAEYLNSAWTVGIIRGIFLFTILYLVAPFAADFFKVPHAKPIIQILGLSFFLGAFTNIGIVYFQKEFEFKRQFVYQLSTAFADFVVAVSAALILKSVWAIVYGLLAGNCVGLIMSYIVHPYRPRLSLDLRRARELWGFGRWVSGSSILIFLITQGDDVFVGKVLGVAALGLYQLAYKISNLPATEITHVISQVTFPAYSKLQDDIPSLREAYLKVLQVTAFLSFPVAGLIFALAPEFTKIFLGEKWMPMVPAMQVLVVAGLVRSIAATSGSMFGAVGKPKVDTLLQVVRLSVLALLIYPLAIGWGIVGASMAVLVSIFISNIGFSFVALRITKCGTANFLKSIVFPFFNGVIIVLLIANLKTIMSIGFAGLLLLICIGISTYVLMTYLADKVFSYKIQSLIKESLQALKGL